MIADWILLLNVVTTVMMTGLVWFVQVVHYPLFSHVGQREFVRYEQLHTRRAGFVIMPLMLTELGSAIGLLVVETSLVTQSQALLGLVLLLLIWMSTFLIQVPLHRKLSKYHDDTAIRRLIQTNWLRTLLWSGRTVLCGWIVLSAL